MSSNTLVRLILLGIVLLLVDAVICVAIFLPQTRRAAVTPAAVVQAAVTRAALPSATAPATRQVASPTATARPSQPTVTPARTTLTSIPDVAQAIQAGRHGVPFSIVFDEDQITAEIDAYLRSSGDLTFSDVQVVLQPGVAIISGKARVLSFDVSAKATTTVVLVNGQPRLKVLQLDALGGLLPGFVKNELIKLIEQNADLPLLDDLPVTLTGIDIQTGQAVVTGTTN